MDKAANLTADEKTILTTSLAHQRAAVLWKLEGLTDEQLRRPVVPSGTSLLGLTKHLAGTEYGWFCEPFGAQTEPYPFDLDADPESDKRVGPDEKTEEIIAFYRRACAAADRVIEEVGLDGLGKTLDGHPVSMRWVLVP